MFERTLPDLNASMPGNIPRSVAMVILTPLGGGKVWASPLSGCSSHFPFLFVSTNIQQYIVLLVSSYIYTCFFAISPLTKKEVKTGTTTWYLLHIGIYCTLETWTVSNLTEQPSTHVHWHDDRVSRGISPGSRSDHVYRTLSLKLSREVTTHTRACLLLLFTPIKLLKHVDIIRTSGITWPAYTPPSWMGRRDYFTRYGTLSFCYYTHLAFYLHLQTPCNVDVLHQWPIY